MLTRREVFPLALATAAGAPAQVPAVQFAKQRIARLLVGGIPVSGGSRWQEMIHHFRAVNVKKLLRRCEKLGINNLQSPSCGHIIRLLKNRYPINLLTRIKDVPEVVNLFCATANPVEAVVAESPQGRGVLGVIDGASHAGVEGPDGIAWRHSLLRKIGYKL